jgi:bacterial/archaeal transporter family-2 protein
VKTTLVIGALAALGTGLAIGAQSTLSSRLGSLIGNVRTGLLMNLAGGALAGLIVGVWGLRSGWEITQIPRPAWWMLITAGALGLAIITGVAFSLQRTGVAAGLAGLILGQLLISVIADTTGVGQVTPIPLTPQRVLGLVVMAAGVLLILPKE